MQIIISVSELGWPAGFALDQCFQHQPLLNRKTLVNESTRQFDLGSFGQFLSGNGQRQLRGCRPAVWGPILRCRGPEQELPESALGTGPRITARLQKPQPMPLGRESFGIRNQVGGTGLQKRRRLLYARCLRKTRLGLSLLQAHHYPDTHWRAYDFNGNLRKLCRLLLAVEN